MEEFEAAARYQPRIKSLRTDTVTAYQCFINQDQIDTAEYRSGSDHPFAAAPTVIFTGT